MHLLIALVLQATAPDVVAQPQPAATQTVSAPTQQAQAATAQAAPATPRTEVRCRWAVPTGQRLRERVCETVELIDERQMTSEEATRHFTANRGISQ